MRRSFSLNKLIIIISSQNDRTSIPPLFFIFTFLSAGKSAGTMHSRLRCSFFRYLPAGFFSRFRSQLKGGLLRKVLSPDEISVVPLYPLKPFPQLEIITVPVTIYKCFVRVLTYCSSLPEYQFCEIRDLICSLLADGRHLI